MGCCTRRFGDGPTDTLVLAATKGLTEGMLIVQVLAHECARDPELLGTCDRMEALEWFRQNSRRHSPSGLDSRPDSAVLDGMSPEELGHNYLPRSPRSNNWLALG